MINGIEFRYYPDHFPYSCDNRFEIQRYSNTIDFWHFNTKDLENILMFWQESHKRFTSDITNAFHGVNFEYHKNYLRPFFIGTSGVKELTRYNMAEVNQMIDFWNSMGCNFTHLDSQFKESEDTLTDEYIEQGNSSYYKCIINGKEFRIFPKVKYHKLQIQSGYGMHFWVFDYKHIKELLEFWQDSHLSVFGYNIPRDIYGVRFEYSPKTDSPSFIITNKDSKDYFVKYSIDDVNQMISFWNRHGYNFSNIK